MERIAAALPLWLSSLTVLAIALGAALIAHWLLFAIARYRGELGLSRAEAEPS